MDQFNLIFGEKLDNEIPDYNLEGAYKKAQQLYYDKI